MLKQGLLWLLISATLPLQADEKLQNCYLEGVERAALCGQIKVPLDYERNNDGSQLSLHFGIVNAVSGQALADPLFVFTGGPGQAALDIAFFSNTAFEAINLNRDIVFIDQRGTGRSHALTCQDFSMNDSADALTASFQKCFAELPYDPNYFTSLSVIKDVEQIRQALGYHSINLWGGSYGTRSAQLYAFTYPEHVRSIILDAPLAINANALIHGGTYAIDALKLLIEDCKNDRLCQHYYPDLNHHIKELFALGKERYKIDPLALRHHIRSASYSPLSRSLVPYAISELINGNHKPIDNLSRLLPASDVMYIGATLSIICMEDVYPQATQQASQLEDKNYIGDSYYKFWQSACGNIHAQHKPDYLNPQQTLPIPTLILTGKQDPITPPDSGKKAQAFLSNSQLIIMKNGGHIISYFGCVPKLMAEFIQTLNPVDASCVDDTKRHPFYIAQQQLFTKEQ